MQTFPPRRPGSRLDGGALVRVPLSLSRPVLAQPLITKNGNPADPLPSLQSGLSGRELHQLPAGDPPQGVFGADSHASQHGGESGRRRRAERHPLPPLPRVSARLRGISPLPSPPLPPKPLASGLNRLTFLGIDYTAVSGDSSGLFVVFIGRQRYDSFYGHYYKEMGTCYQ